jgi:hypothetical protein
MEVERERERDIELKREGYRREEEDVERDINLHGNILLLTI